MNLNKYELYSNVEVEMGLHRRRSDGHHNERAGLLPTLNVSGNDICIQ